MQVAEELCPCVGFCLFISLVANQANARIATVVVFTNDVAKLPEMFHCDVVCSMDGGATRRVCLRNCVSRCRTKSGAC